VLEKLGMTREGTLRENIRAHDAWRDSAVWSVLEHEWRAVH
jgi:RimJ/RimL family protein N-acetyltransferase